MALDYQAQCTCGHENTDHLFDIYGEGDDPRAECLDCPCEWYADLSRYGLERVSAT